MSLPGTAPPLALPAFDNTLGALLVGGLVATGLWGVTCVQTFTFFARNSRDQALFKLMIAFLCVSFERALDTFDSILNGHILYHYLVTNYLNPTAIMEVIWSVIIHVAATSVSNFIIRSMFAYRFFRLSKGNIPVTGWIMAASLTDLVCGLVITVKAFGITSYLELDKLSSLLYLNFAAGTTSDLSVALALSWLLIKSRTGFRRYSHLPTDDQSELTEGTKRTDSLINILMAYAVNTGLIVAIDAALGMITYAVMPNNFIFLGFYLLLSKLYLNSYLATLNARDDLREKIEDPVSIHLSQMSGPRHHSATQSSNLEKGSRAETVAISVRTLVEKSNDNDNNADADEYRTPSHSIARVY
ncbi:hypothetical protein D9615_005604 [Tricholomella constricta]|uniref:DUF6534 domain-containing protein n=1 Tax=Tricholomella constricta TaxID=117010 RepID=A0A8H5HE59_9AGAR|nr:hypothetical protein D9615_005604 [Tricholomella constricta]